MECGFRLAMRPLLICLLVIDAFAQDQQVLTGENVLRFQQLNFSSPSPQIFHSTFGLLQQWSNTFFPNGHTIAPCRIPKNTNLYHARANGDLPPSPEWLAFDPAMSYWILGTTDDSHMLTYKTTREVRCLYFDGTSAALMGDGSMDSQMLLIHNSSSNVPNDPIFGRPPPSRGNDPHSPPYDYPYHAPGNGTRRNPIQGEYDRANGLCDFIASKNLGGPGWGFEGIVRMNAGFELIWCNFSSPSAKLISNLNVSAPPLIDTEEESLESINLARSDDSIPEKPPRKPKAPSWIPNHPFRAYAGYDWFQASTKRYGYSGSKPGRGEARVKIDTCNVFTFYDPALLDQSRAKVVRDRHSLHLTEDGYWHSPSGTSRQAALQVLERRRRVERPMNVSTTDGHYMRSAVENRMRHALTEAGDKCSGIEWTLVVEEVVASYGLELYRLRRLLGTVREVTNSDGLRLGLASLRELLHSMYMPYYEYPAFEMHTIGNAFDIASIHSKAAYARCQAQYTPVDEGFLSVSETVTHVAVSDVLTALCDTTLRVFLLTEKHWLTLFNNASAHAPSRKEQETAKLALRQSFYAIEELMAWLGWADQWTSCEPGCGINEVCYIPMWPVLGLGPSANGSNWNPIDDIKQRLWHPRCVDAEHWPMF